MQNPTRCNSDLTRAIYFTLVSVATVCFCIGCSTSEHRTDSIIPNSSDGSIQPSYRTGEQTIKDFLCWYNDNHKTLNKIQLVINSPPTGDDTKYYSVNFEGTELWLKILKESGFVSNGFLSHWRAYFKEAEKAFRSDPVSDGPPAGFEYDFIYNSQENFPLNVDIQHATVTQDSIEGNKAIFVLNVRNYGAVAKTLLKSRDGNWLLAK